MISGRYDDVPEAGPSIVTDLAGARKVNGMSAHTHAVNSNRIIRRDRVGRVLMLHGAALVPELAHGARAALNRCHLHLSMAPFTPENARVSGSRIAPDGLLACVDESVSGDAIATCLLQTIPCVAVNLQRLVDCVYIDERHNAREATRYLMALGHRRICLYSTVEPQPRHQGYKEALEEVGLDSSEIPASSHELCRLLQSWRRPTAIIAGCANDARCVLDAASQSELFVPMDLSLLALGNSALAIGSTEITTFAPSLKKLGESAASLLIAKLQDPARAFKPMPVTPELILGCTAGPAPLSRANAGGSS